MKKIIISALLLVSIAGTAFSRNHDAIGNQVLNSFNKSFSNAQEVKWEAQKDFVKVTFVIDGQTMYAYYKSTGEQMAVTRNISSTQLPIHLAASLKQRLNGGWISDLFEVSSEGSTVYYATVENAAYHTILKADVAENWIIFKKDKRDGQ